MAMRLDGEIDLVAGAFSASAEKSKLSGQELLIDPKRVYPDYQSMAMAEAKLPAGERIDFVTVVTPNQMHVPVWQTFLEAGFHVVCDKPLGIDLAEALAVRQIVRQTGRVFGLTYNYTGYPMVKQAQALVREGELGEIRKVVAEYAQGWLHRPIELEGQKQAAWRTDPKQAGTAGCVGDIGTHAENLARYITGLEIEELCAEFTLSSRVDLWKTMPAFSCVTPEGRGEFCTRLKSAPTKKTAWRSRSTAPKHRSHGNRKALTNWW